MQDGKASRLLQNLKQCLDDFSGQNIEIACNLLESCGRYLLNTIEGPLLKEFNQHLDLMWRLKEKDKISSRQLANIEQAYYMCRPHQYRSSRVTAVQR